VDSEWRAKATRRKEKLNSAENEMRRRGWLEVRVQSSMSPGTCKEGEAGEGAAKRKKKEQNEAGDTQKHQER